MKTHTTTHKTNGRKTMNDALIMLLRAGAIATFGLVLCAGMAAGAFPADWTHSDLIMIEEDSGSDLTDYQIPVELNASNFDFTKAQPDGADIRFAELGGTMLSHWIEDWDSTAEGAKVWVKVPSIPAGDVTTIQMWYGNAGATSESNFTETMLLPLEVIWHTTTDYADNYVGIITLDVDSNNNIYGGDTSGYASTSYLVKFAPNGTEVKSISMYSNILSIVIDGSDNIFVTNGPWGYSLRVYDTDLNEQCHYDCNDYRENVYQMKLVGGYVYAPSYRSSSPPYNAGISKFDASCNVIETTTYHSSHSGPAGGNYHHAATDKTYAGFHRADDSNYLRLARFTGASSLDWDKLVLADSKAHIQDIIYKDGYLYISGTGKRDEIGTNAYIFLAKYDLDGSRIWMRNYTDVADYTTAGKALMEIGDNLLLMPANYCNGSHYFPAFYAVDFDGNLVWRGYIDSISNPDWKVGGTKLLDDKKILLGGRDGSYGDLTKVSYYKQVEPEPTVTITDSSSGWSADARLTDSPTDDKLPGIVVLSSGEKHVIWNAGTQIKQIKSTADGWSSEHIVKGATSYFYSRPDVAKGSDDRIHTVYINGPTFGAEVEYKVYDAGTWSTGTQVSNSGVYAGVEDITVSPSNPAEVHVTWHDYKHGGYTYRDIFYRKYNGITWEPEVQISSAEAGTASKVVVDSEDNVYVAWHRGVDGSYNKIYYKIFNNHTGTWSSELKLTDQTGSTLEINPEMAIDSNDNLHIVWRDDRDGNNEIYYKCYNGSAWSNDLRLTVSTGDSFCPDIEIGPYDNLHVVWEDRRDGNGEIYYKKFDGLNWGLDTRLTNDSARSSSPDIESSDDGLHLVWSDDRDGDREVYYKHLPLTSVSASIAIGDATAQPNSTTTTPIAINNMTNFGAATVTLSYDPTVVWINSTSAGDLGTPTANINNTVGTATIAAYVSTTTGPDSPITFANLELLAVGSNGETSPLTLAITTLTDADGTTVPATAESGVFTIAGLRGDAKDDGVVDIIDAMYVAQYVVGNRDASTLNMANADANLDGDVTIVDAMFIAQYVVGSRTW